MSPIPKPERKKTPVEKAIAAMLASAQKPASLVIHPSDVAEVKALLEAAGQPTKIVPVGPDSRFVPQDWEALTKQMLNTPLQVGRPEPVVVKEGPLMKAYREGMMTTGISWDEQHQMDKSQLERDLEDSLWALAGGIVPATEADVAVHSHHQQGSNHRIKRLHPNAVDILCPCKMVLRFHRCGYVYDGYEHAPEDWNTDRPTPPAGSRCTEEISQHRFDNVNQRCSFHD